MRNCILPSDPPIKTCARATLLALELVCYLEAKLPMRYWWCFVIERSRFIDCLGPNGTVLKVSEGKNLETTCIYYGLPTPSLTCILLDENRRNLTTTIPRSVARNYTTKDPMIFFDVGATAKTLQCTIYHAATGRVVKYRSVLVYGRYHCLFHFDICACSI